jgi:hypothetical protein
VGRPLAAGQTLEHQSRPGVRAKKKARDRLTRLAATHPAWVLGYLDATWGSRLAQPPLHARAAAEPPRLVEQAAARTDPDPKALSCYGLLRDATGHMLLRFVPGRPVSQVAEAYRAWACARPAREGKKALLLVGDNAPWPVSRRVRAWIKAPNRRGKQAGGVRLLACYLPVKSPWLNAIEPKWVRGKKAIVEPERLLSAQEIKGRVGEHYRREQLEPLVQRVETKRPCKIRKKAA